METKGTKAGSVPGTGAANQETSDAANTSGQPSDTEAAKANDAEKSSEDNSTDKSTAETPEWVERVIASNEAVVASNTELIASNEAVVEAVNRFQEAAPAVAGEIVKHAQAAMSGDSSVAANVISVPEVDPDANYVVGKGKKFKDRDHADVYYTAGMSVSHLDDERLANLLAQGIIEVSQDEEDD